MKIMVAFIFILFAIIMISSLIIIKSHNNTINSQYYEKVLDYLDKDENYSKIVKGKQIKKLGVYHDPGYSNNGKAYLSFIILSYGESKLIISALYFWEIEEKNEIVLERIVVFEYF